MKPKENKSHLNAVVRVETVDPSMAQKMLDNLFPGQRRLREGHVLRLASEMETGHWHLSPDALLIIAGKLANGQHRLQALLLYGKPLPFILMISNDENLYKVLDSGAHRTTADALGEMPYAREVASTVNLVLSYDYKLINSKGSSKLVDKQITRSTIVDYIEGHQKELIAEVSECMSLNQTRRILSPVIGATLLHLANRRATNDAPLTFIRNVYIGGSADAAFDLREKLIRNASSTTKFHRFYMFGLLIKAYRSFLNGTRPGVLRITDGENFPEMP